MTTHAISSVIRPAARVSFRVKDPGSALTHFIALCACILATPAMLVNASLRGIGLAGQVSLSVFLLSAILLYGASTAYHSFDISPRGNLALKRLDHMMIFVLIAGTYTPFCVLAVGGAAGVRLLVLIWALALVGILFKACWVKCPRWVSSVVYIAMGWACVGELPRIWSGISVSAFVWLLLGGLFYTVGGIIYALKLPVFNARFPHFGSHEVFHLFVMAGTACHFVLLWLLCAG